MDTYLGSAAGARVLRGTIKRGDGLPIEAIIWASDLRGFTDLSNRLDGADMLTVLNA
jgi:adenylate cyclase